MARNISFALTTPQFLDGTKDVTRRQGWSFLQPGDELCVIKKGMGLKKGEQVERLGMIRVVDVRREPLRRIVDDREYGVIEVGREGFPAMTTKGFVEFYCGSHKHCKPESTVTRIEFERIFQPPTEA